MGTESLECRRCGSKMSRVLETRDITVHGHYFKLRVRECYHCKKQFRSKEILDSETKLPSKSRSKKLTAPDPPETPPIFLPEKDDSGNPFL